MRLDFWPLKELLDKEFYINVPGEDRRIGEISSRRSITYSDGKWTYKADSANGIDVEIRCECGKMHKIHLGANLYCGPPAKDDTCIDAEVLEEDGRSEEPDGDCGEGTTLPGVPESDGAKNGG